MPRAGPGNPLATQPVSIAGADLIGAPSDDRGVVRIGASGLEVPALRTPSGSPPCGRFATRIARKPWAKDAAAVGGVQVFRWESCR
jgi:hypothetical protein